MMEIVTVSLPYSVTILIIYRHYPEGEILFVKKQILKKTEEKR